MYLLLGNSEDLCCASVRKVLEARNRPTLTIANPFVYPSRLAWRLDDEQSVSHLAWRDALPMRDDEIVGVFVRSTGWIDPIGWQQDDLNYIQAETQAALLAWLWSLHCTVVNRYSASLWYRPHVPLLSWRRLLQRCGLPTPSTLVTNVDIEAREFGRQLAREGVAGAVYGPLTSNARYLVSGEIDWAGLAALQRCAPVCLAEPHGAVQFACVVGEQVVWEGEPSVEGVVLEPALQRFAAATGLAFVELALAPTSNDLCVIAVEPHPNVQHFGDAARQRIAETIADLLTAGVADRHVRDEQVMQRKYG